MEASAVVPDLPRSLSRVERDLVDAHLRSLRLRQTVEALGRLREVCPGVSVARLARAGGILLRLALNFAGAWRSSRWRPSPPQECSRYERSAWSSRLGWRRVLAMSELLYLLSSVLAAGCRVLPVARSSGGEAGFGDWCTAASGAGSLRPLASYSLLAQIPRVKNLVPGIWALIRQERIRRRRSSNEEATWKHKISHAATAVAKVAALTAVESCAILVGLLSLYQKLIAVTGTLPSELGLARMSSWTAVFAWFPFVAFANQVTGVVDQQELRMEAVLKVLFSAGSPDDPQPDTEAMCKFNGLLLRDLCGWHGRGRGCLIFLSLTSVDYQRLLVTTSFEDIPVVRIDLAPPFRDDDDGSAVHQAEERGTG